MFSRRLKYLRTSKKLSQQNMGDLLGISRQGYGKYEDGKSEPDHQTLLKLANYFEVTTDYLLGKSDISSLDKKEEKELYEIEKILESMPGDEKERLLKMIKAYADSTTHANDD